MCEQRTCNRCHQAKPLDAYVWSNQKRRHRRICRECENEQGRERYWAKQAQMKTCNTCGETKPTAKFPQRRNICRACRNEGAARRYEARKQKQLAQEWAFLYQPWRA